MVKIKLKAWTMRAARVLVSALAVVGALAATTAAQSQRFSDVPPDHPASAAIEWAADAGLTTGYSDGTFKPQRPLSRWQAVVFMQRYYDQVLQANESEDFTRGDMMLLLKAINDTNTTTNSTPTTSTTTASQSRRFPDVPPDHPASAAVEWAADAGLTTGYSDGTFRPQQPLGRWHAVVFMERYYDQVLQADESEDFTRGDMMLLLKAIDDGTLRPTFGWKVSDDLQLDLDGSGRTRGLWSNGTTFYTACTRDADYLADVDAHLCAFNPTTGDQWKTYHTLQTHGNFFPNGIWSDGTTMWVTDWDDRKIFAYKTRSYFRDTAKEFDLIRIFGSTIIRGDIWSDGTTMWVAGFIRGPYAFDLASGQRAPDKDLGQHFDQIDPVPTGARGGIWADGTTMWVGDLTNRRLVAYDMASGLRAPNKDFNSLGMRPSGIWSDGTTMWVIDDGGRVSSLSMPPESALGPLTAPGTPQNLTAVADGENRISLSWNPPSDDGGNPVKSYRVEVSSDGSHWEHLITHEFTPPHQVNQASHDGLTAGSTYFYRVSATNDLGTSPPSDVFAATTAGGELLAGPCAVQGAVPDAADHPGLVSDCETLLVVKVILEGTATSELNWSADTPITNWHGVSVLGTPRRVQRLSLAYAGLRGRMPPQLETLTELTTLTLRGNFLKGPVPAELGRLTNLRELKLDGNQLSGAIPPALGGLADLRILWLLNNSLTGSVPPELGNLANLEILFLRNNQLSGDVPQELGRLSKLYSLSIGRNRLTGCIPSSLEGQLTGSSTDLGGLDYCAAANRAPQLTGDVEDLIVELGESFKVDVSGLFTDPDGDEIDGYGFRFRTPGILTGTMHTSIGVLSLRAVAVGETVVAVEARDSNGLGRTEDLFKVTVIASEEVAEAPGAVTGLTATADGQTQIDLSWDAPSDDGGADITGYRIEVSPDGATWDVLVADTGTTATSHSDMTPTAGSTRHYRVSAINSAGTGPASNVDSATTEAEGSGTTAQPAGSGIEIRGLECSGEEWYYGSSLYDYRVTGEVYAREDIEDVQVGYGTGYFRDMGFGFVLYDGPVGAFSSLGSMSAGESKSFTIRWTESVLRTACSVEVVWTRRR